MRLSPRVTAPLLAALLPATALAGCGADRSAPQVTTTPASPTAQRQISRPAAGLQLAVPANWRLTEGGGSTSSTAPGGDPAQAPATAPAVTLTSGQAVVAVWRYPRTEPAPEGPDDLQAAKDALLARIRGRDSSFTLDEAVARDLRGVPTIIVLGSETVAGQRVKVRSVHQFAAGAEVVVDAYAPPRLFEKVNGEVFRPLVKSLKISEPQGA